MKKAILLFWFVESFSTFIAAQTFTEVRQVNCGEMTHIGNLGYPTWNDPHIEKLPAFGHAVLLGDFLPPNLLEYTAPPCMVGKDTVIISCAHATQITCDTGIYVFEIGCPENLDPVYPVSLACNDSVYVGNLSGWWSPEIIQTAENGESRIILEPTDGAGVFYRPDPGFEGLDYVKVSINLGADTLLYLFQVYCDLTVGNQEVSAKPIVFYPNPAGAQLLIQEAGQLLDARVYNQQGQLCPAPAKDRDGGFIIETEHLPTGFYFVIITTKQGTRLRGSFIKG